MQESFKKEKVGVVQVQNSVELGKLTALRFIEWVSHNPNGVIALPTGKSPEFFIKFLQHYKLNWQQPDVQKELANYGLTQSAFPETSNLKFVQLDEFYPIDPEHQNSFYQYVKRYYLPLLEIKEENQLLINPAKINDVEQFCQNYEQKIDEWGGIGFFLGGIGTDGHIAFNIAGSSYDSKTRLVKLNYETACGIAASLGGMEYARDATAITIGLDTITRNKNAEIIIIAAGEGKAPIIAHAIENDDINCPATALQKHPGARFYLTQGAASALSERKLTSYLKETNLSSKHELVDQILTACALKSNCTIAQITLTQLKKDKAGVLLLDTHVDFEKLKDDCIARFKNKIQCEVAKEKSILHTSPHHDDIMLSYHPVAINLLANNTNAAVYLTSGFNAVTNSYIQETINTLDRSFVVQNANIIFSKTNQLPTKFAQAYKDNRDQDMLQSEHVIAARYIAEIYNCDTIDDLLNRIEWIKQSYFSSIRPGELDNPPMQQLKGAMRESECDRMWSIHGLPMEHVHHLRSRFYTGEYFTPRPTFKYDVAPLVKLFDQYSPSIVTVAFDPEGTGPDTHYKVLQLVAEAIRAYGNDAMQVWGYRNVWHRFSVAQANVMVPVSAQELDHLDDIFMSCFSTQKEASFPSYFYDGPFSRLSIQIQKEQLEIMKKLLGKEFFENNSDKRIKNAAGLCFLKSMTSNEFLSNAEKLKETTELVSN